MVAQQKIAGTILLLASFAVSALLLSCGAAQPPSVEAIQSVMDEHFQGPRFAGHANVKVIGLMKKSDSEYEVLTDVGPRKFGGPYELKRTDSDEWLVGLPKIGTSDRAWVKVSNDAKKRPRTISRRSKLGETTAKNGIMCFVAEKVETEGPASFDNWSRLTRTASPDVVQEYLKARGQPETFAANMPVPELEMSATVTHLDHTWRVTVYFHQGEDGTWYLGAIRWFDEGSNKVVWGAGGDSVERFIQRCPDGVLAGL